MQATRIVCRNLLVTGKVLFFLILPPVCFSFLAYQIPSLFFCVHSDWTPGGLNEDFTFGPPWHPTAQSGEAQVNLDGPEEKEYRLKFRFRF